MAAAKLLREEFGANQVLLFSGKRQVRLYAAKKRKVTNMLRVKGIYDGKNVKLLETIKLAPNTAVEVLIPEVADDAEDIYWRRLIELGLIRQSRSLTGKPDSYQPVPVSGEPVSETIIRERR